MVYTYKKVAQITPTSGVIEQVYTSLYKFIQVWTSLYKFIQVYTSLYLLKIKIVFTFAAKWLSKILQIFKAVIKWNDIFFSQDFFFVLLDLKWFLCRSLFSCKSKQENIIENRGWGNLFLFLFLFLSFVKNVS